jgi:flagellar hook-associated protein 3 FlgL
MMNAISTSSSYQSILLNILNQQNTEQTDQQQYSTGKIGDNLEAYAGVASQVTAAQALQAQTNTYVQNNTALTDQLTVQDQTLSQVATITENARQAVADAVATGDASSLSTELQSQLTQAVSALNTQYNGQYLFAGGETSTAPVSTSTSLTSITAAGGVAAAFQNGDEPTQSRIDADARITTGFTASSVGTNLFNALSQVATYLQEQQTANGGQPVSTLTPAQTSALTGMLSSFDSAYSAVNNQVAQNGLVQDQLSATQTSLQARQTALTNTLGDLTDVNQAQAATNLQLAQTALQASAQVFASLNNSSLLSVLGTTTTG